MGLDAARTISRIVTTMRTTSLGQMTAEGTNTGSFAPSDWGLLLATAGIWGSSFLWISIGLESLSPAAIAFVRLALGGIALSLYPPARRPVDREAWPIIALIALVGNAGPAVLYGMAQQRVESSVAGMITATTPLCILAISILMLRRSPGTNQVRGLLVGFAGVIIMAAPNVTGADAQPVGVALLLVAVFGYGISSNLTVPLQQKYGGPAVIMRALFLGTLVLAPWGGSEAIRSSPTRNSLIAVIILGVAGTGIARAMSASLGGRTGASRAALIGYLVPIVAIVLGVVFRDETVEAAEIAGTVLILCGAFLTSRKQPDRRPSS